MEEPISSSQPIDRPHWAWANRMLILGSEIGPRPYSVRCVSAFDWRLLVVVSDIRVDRKIENFIRTKYESKRWVMDGGMPDPSTLDDGDDDVVSAHDRPSS